MCWLRHPNGDNFIGANQTYSQIGDCIEFYCTEDLVLVFNLCDMVPINDELSCQISEVDNSKIFPRCCPYEDCDDNK